MKTSRTPAIVVAGLLATTLAMPASAAHMARIEGATRDETAVALSKATGFGEPSGTDPNNESVASAIVTRRDNFPDALAASYLSQALGGAPILLTDTNDLTDVTADELARLNAERVYVLGQQQAVGAAVEDELAEDYEVVRIGGTTRYSTAQLIAQFNPGDDASDVGTLGTSGRTAFVVTGENFPDALAAGPLSFHSSFPIILTSTASLSDEAADALDALDIEHAIVLGGPVAVQPRVEDELRALGLTTQRLSGDTRHGTAVQVANFARTQLGFTQDDVLFAVGDNFPDALAAGPYGGAIEAPIVLAERRDLVGATTLDFLRSQAASVDTVITLGGPDAISVDTEEEAAGAVE